MRLGSGFHLTYCSNTHAGETWDETFAALKAHVPEVRRRVCPGEPFGIGLRLSAAAVRTLEDGALAVFRAWLASERCYVFTLSGFPLGVAPDWASEARYRHTRSLAKLLAALLPDGVEGSIATVPLGDRCDFTGAAGTERRERCIAHLVRTAQFLAALEASSGRLIRLGLEPELDAAIETSAEFARFFNERLLPAAREHAGRRGEDCMRRHVGLCVDTCHASVVGEPIAQLLPAIAAAGVTVCKLQVSAALRVDLPAGEGGELRQRLARLLATCVEGHCCQHLEIETSDWDVLPESARGGLHDAIAREFRWALERLPA